MIQLPILLSQMKNPHVILWDKSGKVALASGVLVNKGKYFTCDILAQAPGYVQTVMFYDHKDVVHSVDLDDSGWDFEFDNRNLSANSQITLFFEDAVTTR